MDFFSNPKKYAHAKAKSLMQEEFFWSAIDEAGPFGSDSGADAAEGFNQWRKRNPDESPIKFLSDLLVSWGMPLLDWNELDESKIREFIETKAAITDLPQQVDQFKEMIKNSGTDFASDLTDQSFQDMILQSAAGMGVIYLLQMDNAIIGTGFAQFVMEGKLDEGLQYLTHTALKRQLLPVLIERYDTGHQEIRKEILGKMVRVIEQANL